MAARLRRADEAEADAFVSWRNAAGTLSVRVYSFRKRLPAKVEELPERTR
ncbi:MAG: hypothetical protein OXF78_11680 [Rhodospirillales bacterium]|nr:hypothetical protein [Rhodospirillales bacterium]